MFNVQLPYDINQALDLELWNSNFHTILLHRSMKHLAVMGCFGHENNFYFPFFFYFSFSDFIGVLFSFSFSFLLGDEEVCDKEVT